MLTHGRALAAFQQHGDALPEMRVKDGLDATTGLFDRTYLLSVFLIVREDIEAQG